MRHLGILLGISVALTGCASLQPHKGPATPQVAPVFACQSESWRALARTNDISTPEGWWRVTDAAKFAPGNSTCCLMPDNTFAFCPKELNLTDLPMAEWDAARRAAQEKAATDAAAQQQVTPK